MVDIPVRATTILRPFVGALFTNNLTAAFPTTNHRKFQPNLSNYRLLSFTTQMSTSQKIKVANPVVDLDGDEMTRM
jgi:hypothetical protein